MDGWMDGRIDGWMGGWSISAIGGYVSELIGWTDGCLGELMDAWMNE